MDRKYRIAWLPGDGVGNRRADRQAPEPVGPAARDISLRITVRD